MVVMDSGQCVVERMEMDNSDTFCKVDNIDGSGVRWRTECWWRKPYWRWGNTDDSGGQWSAGDGVIHAGFRGNTGSGQWSIGDGGDENASIVKWPFTTNGRFQNSGNIDRSGGLVSIGHARNEMEVLENSVLERREFK